MQELDRLAGDAEVEPHVEAGATGRPHQLADIRDLHLLLQDGPVVGDRDCPVQAVDRLLGEAQGVGQVAEAEVAVLDGTGEAAAADLDLGCADGQGEPEVVVLGGFGQHLLDAGGAGGHCRLPAVVGCQSNDLYNSKKLMFCQ